MTQPRYSIPARSLDELEMIRSEDWTFSSLELLSFVNQAAEDFLPESKSEDGRLSDQLSLRTLRHYQTLGCIDPPEKDGRNAVYRYRQYLQALLVRKLLFEGFSAQQIKQMLAGLTHEGLYKRLLERVDVLDENGRIAKQSSEAIGPITSSTITEIDLGGGLTLSFRHNADEAPLEAREILRLAAAKLNSTQ